MYIGHFTNKKDILQEFSHSYDSVDDNLKDELKNCKVLLAWYGSGDYEGTAFVLFERDSKLYEVNGGHCSCFGLEGQWEPEETSVDALRHRIEEGYLGRDYYGYDKDSVFDVPLKKILTRWERKHHHKVTLEKVQKQLL